MLSQLGPQALYLSVKVSAIDLELILMYVEYAWQTDCPGAEIRVWGAVG